MFAYVGFVLPFCVIYKWPIVILYALSEDVIFISYIFILYAYTYDVSFINIDYIEAYYVLFYLLSSSFILYV